MQPSARPIHAAPPFCRTPQLHASFAARLAAPHAADREPSYDDDDGLDDDEEGDGPMFEDAASNPTPSPNASYP